jgi:hypothetical protein
MAHLRRLRPPTASSAMSGARGRWNPPGRVRGCAPRSRISRRAGAIVAQPPAMPVAPLREPNLGLSPEPRPKRRRVAVCRGVLWRVRVAVTVWADPPMRMAKREGSKTAAPPAMTTPMITSDHGQTSTPSAITIPITLSPDTTLNAQTSGDLLPGSAAQSFLLRMFGFGFSRRVNRF